MGLRTLKLYLFVLTASGVCGPGVQASSVLRLGVSGHWTFPVHLFTNI